MDLRSSLGIGRIRGIDIRVHWSWLLILAFLTWSLATGLFREANPHWTPVQAWLAAVTSSLLFFASILLHELAHSFVALRAGIPVPSITLFVFGGVSAMGAEMTSAGDEFRVAIAGPLTSWLLAAVFAGLWLVLGEQSFGIAFGYLALVNFALGAFNLLPGFPLDGGRVFRSIVWQRTGDLTRATKTAANGGTVIAITMIVFGVVSTFAFGVDSGLWYVLVGLFLNGATRASYEQTLVERAISHVRVQDVTRTSPPEPVPASTTLQRLVDGYVLATGKRAYYVATAEGRVAGRITVTDIAAVPRDQWA